MSTFRFGKNNLLLTDIVPSMPQLLDNSKPVQTRTSESTVPAPYPETAYQWLARVLDGLIDFGRRHGHYGIIELTEDEYQWLDDVLEELIYSIGEDENHPLAPLMEFVIRLIANYEDKYVPKLTELFPGLAEEAPVEVPNKNSNPPPYASELSDNELAAHGFFSIGCLLWEGGKTEKALSAYDTAVRLQPNYAEVYNNRGNIKSRLDSRDAALDDYGEAIRLNPNFAEAYSNRGSTKFRLGKHAAALADLNAAIRLQPNFMNTYANRGVAQLGLGNIDAAKSDFQVALELVEQQENDNLKTFVEEQLQQLNQAASKQNNKKPRRGGQWKGKVKIAEDFDELPEPFMESFRREDE
ncbi:tetratricopeptide repeat protein [Candidatus Poribacteria bacterium]|nr:tetratricopeptide repeat protein [Candidatus Poribacteria bacterium]MYA56430.1 tetratricopeptide repeat protein [Candidatus Poribacteria bacterium]